MATDCQPEVQYLLSCSFHRIENYRYRSFEQLVQEQECMLFFKASIYLSLYLRRIVREHIDCPLLQIGPRF